MVRCLFSAKQSRVNIDCLLIGLSGTISMQSDSKFDNSMIQENTVEMQNGGHFSLGGIVSTSHVFQY